MPSLANLFNTVDSPAQSCECNPDIIHNHHAMTRLNQIKICGLSTRQAIDAVIKGGDCELYQDCTRMIGLESLPY